MCPDKFGHVLDSTLVKDVHWYVPSVLDSPAHLSWTVLPICPGQYWDILYCIGCVWLSGVSHLSRTVLGHPILHWLCLTVRGVPSVPDSTGTSYTAEAVFDCPGCPICPGQSWDILYSSGCVWLSGMSHLSRTVLGHPILHWLCLTVRGVPSVLDSPGTSYTAVAVSDCPGCPICPGQSWDILQQWLCLTVRDVPSVLDSPGTSYSSGCVWLSGMSHLSWTVLGHQRTSYSSGCLTVRDVPSVLDSPGTSEDILQHWLCLTVRDVPSVPDSPGTSYSSGCVWLSGVSHLSWDILQQWLCLTVRDVPFVLDSPGTSYSSGCVWLSGLFRTILQHILPLRLVICSWNNKVIVTLVYVMQLEI